jgi:hypothetical protein
MDSTTLKQMKFLTQIALIWALWLPAVQADTVFYDGSNVAYQNVTDTLRDVYGDGSSTGTGSWSQVNYGLYQINGTGNQSIKMSFLYDDGSYQFEFGYFEVTSTLQALPYNTVAEKQAWAIQALSTAAIVFTDGAVTTDADDLYTGAANDANRSHDTGGGDNYDTANDATVTLQGGKFYSFFIIPNNTLANFQADAADGTFSTFALNGSGAGAWPLFAVSPGNPGDQADGSGDGRDQAFTFFGTTRNTSGSGGALASSNNNGFDPDPNSPGSVITFEDIWRGGGGSDNDFNDLHFYIDNTLAAGVTVPEPAGWVWGLPLGVCLFVSMIRRQRRRASQTL